MVVLVVSTTLQSVLYNDILAPRLGNPKVVFLGDSITQDAGLWTVRLRRFDFDTWNLGQRGMTTTQIRTSQAEPISRHHPLVAFIMAGANDQDRSAEGVLECFSQYRAMLETLSDAGTATVIVLTVYRQDDTSPQFVTSLNRMLVDYAEENGIEVIDLNSSLAPNASLLPQYSRDGLHLTEEAYDLWARQARDVLGRLGI